MQKILDCNVNRVSLTMAVKMVDERWRTFGQWLRREFDRAGLKHVDIAKKSGITDVQISRIINGASGAKRDTIENIINAANQASPNYKINLNEALNLAGFATVETKTYPQTDEEFTEALKKFGVCGWKIPESDLERISPEFYKMVLEMLESTIKGQLQKIEEGEVLDPSPFKKVA